MKQSWKHLLLWLFGVNVLNMNLVMIGKLYGRTIDPMVGLLEIIFGGSNMRNLNMLSTAICLLLNEF